MEIIVRQPCILTDVYRTFCLWITDDAVKCHNYYNMQSPQKAIQQFDKTLNKEKIGKCSHLNRWLQSIFGLINDVKD